MKVFPVAFLKDESGATAIEYALIAAGMTVAIIAAVGVLAGGITDGYQSIADKLTSE